MGANSHSAVPFACDFTSTNPMAGAVAMITCAKMIESQLNQSSAPVHRIYFDESKYISNVPFNSIIVERKNDACRPRCQNVLEN